MREWTTENMTSVSNGRGLPNPQFSIWPLVLLTAGFMRAKLKSLTIPKEECAEFDGVRNVGSSRIEAAKNFMKKFTLFVLHRK